MRLRKLHRAWKSLFPKEVDKSPVSRQATIWAIRFFLGRDPLNEAEIRFHRQHASFVSLRMAFAQTREFKSFYAHQCGGFFRDFVPSFLLRTPDDRRIPWKFEPPTLADPTSQLCTEAQFAEPLHVEICSELRENPSILHRKIWEYSWITAALLKAGALRPGMRALGFGVGREPLPAFFGKHGVAVVATDAPLEAIDGHGWESTGQHAAGLDALRRPLILDNATFDRLVSFEAVDMNKIPEHLQGFDFCWSACSLEHLGSIEHGLRFVEESLETLRPGGIAIHTTEFNLSSNNETFEAPTLSLFRKVDIEKLFSRLIAKGHKPWPLNLHPGTGLADEHIDLPPYANNPHLKLEVAMHVVTSIGLVVQKGEA